MQGEDGWEKPASQDAGPFLPQPFRVLLPVVRGDPVEVVQVGGGY